MDILIGKTGEHVTVPFDTYAPHVVEYVIRYGLTQILNDAHASITAKEEPDRDARHAAVNALVAKKLAALAAGEVRSNGGGRTGDPVMAEAKKIATARLRAAIKAKGRKWSDLADDAIRNAVSALIAANPDIMVEAKANVEAARAKASDVNLSELGL